MMPSKKQYNLVSDDAYDSRIPLYNEEAFQHGIHFHAKYIGSLDVPRPSSRVEIVAAMRRIRYEFKAKSMKKKKVTITVCVDGVKVVLRSKRKSNAWPWDENKFILLHHPIYRIFYVSHDSQDLKIFSYIARDGGTNAFKCNVFKSKKKSQAMRIVRTIGQAFEVCHKLSMALASSSASGGPSDETDDNALQDNSTKGKCQGDGASEPNSCDTQEETIGPKFLDSPCSTSPQHSNGNNLNAKDTSEPSKPSLMGSNNFPESSSVYHHIQLLKEQLEQQSQQMQSVAGQVQLLKDQLAAETTARLEAQSQNHHLLAHNRELLEHIKKLVNHVHEVEEKYHKTDKFDTSLPEPFLAGSSFNSNSYASSSKLLAHNSPLSTAKFSTDLDRAPSEPLFPRTYPSPLGRQLSVPGGSARNASPKFGVTFNNNPVELPGYFDSSTTGFACSSPKPPRKGRSAGQIPDEVDRSPGSVPPSSASPGYRQKKQGSVFDFDGSVPSSPFRPKKSSVFDFEPTMNSFRREFESDFCPPDANGTRESFIAQVTRDLAKMSTGSDRHLSDSSSKSYPDSGFSSVFKS